VPRVACAGPQVFNAMPERTLKKGADCMKYGVNESFSTVK
jgi:hypothetical protein